MTHPLQILIADDDRHTRAGLRALLGTWPACAIVGEATNGQEALEQIERWRPDAVLLDLHMPVLDGIQAAGMIKERWPEITIVVLTMDAGQRSAALAAGADGFVSKADGPDQVVKTLQVVCGRGNAGAAGRTGEPAT